MTSPQSEIFEDVEWDMLTPTEFEFPANSIDSVRAIHPEFLQAYLELDLLSNPPSEPLTEEVRQKRMEELAILYPVPSEDTPPEKQWWLNLFPSLQQPMDIYTCDPTNENSLCSLGVCAVCCPQPALIEVVEDDSSDFTEILASFGVPVLPKLKLEEETIPLWDENYNWVTQSS